MATWQARALSKTAAFADADNKISFSPTFRPQPEPGYWIELATTHAGAALSPLAGRLGPLSGAQAGSESLGDWQAFQSLNIGVLKALIASRPEIVENISDDLREKLRACERQDIPAWTSLPAAATALVANGYVVLSSLTPVVFDAPSAKGRVLALALNEAMKANEICACVVCDTVFTASARSRQYCSPACRKAAAIAPKVKSGDQPTKVS